MSDKSFCFFIRSIKWPVIDSNSLLREDEGGFGCTGVSFLADITTLGPEAELHIPSS